MEVSYSRINKTYHPPGWR